MSAVAARSAPEALLEIDGLAVAYDGMRALQDVSLRAEAGTIVALIGANGAGKTSLLRAISGLVRAQAGTIRFDGDDITRMPAHRIVRRGIAHVPEGRRVFASATVHDNLLLGAYVDRDAAHREARLEAAFAAFPILRERLEQRASTLSGGEQQMLAIAALGAADTAYVLQTGRVVSHGAASDLIGDPLVQEAFLGISAA